MFLVNSRPGLVTATSFKEAPLLPKLRGYFAEFLRESCLAPLGILYLPTCVGFGYRYPFVESRSSFSWEYDMGYFSVIAPGTRTSARGIFSTPSDPEKAGSPCVLEPITIFSANLASSVPPYQQGVVQEYSPVVHRLRLSA